MAVLNSVWTAWLLSSSWRSSFCLKYDGRGQTRQKAQGTGYFCRLAASLSQRLRDFNFARRFESFDVGLKMTHQAFSTSDSPGCDSLFLDP